MEESRGKVAAFVVERALSSCHKKYIVTIMRESLLCKAPSDEYPRFTNFPDPNVPAAEKGRFPWWDVGFSAGGCLPRSGALVLVVATKRRDKKWAGDPTDRKKISRLGSRVMNIRNVMTSDERRADVAGW